MPEDYSRYTDEQLFAAFKQSGKKKDAAFRELFSRYERKVYVFCLRLSGNPDDANDIFQETFTRFYKQTLKDSEKVSNILAYLLTSARNVFLNTRRNKVYWSPFEDEHIADHMPMYERKELLTMISTALELLDVPYREAFILRFYQGLSYKEISEITGDSVSSLKVRVMRAKDQVRTILQPYIADLSR
ncbi:MAG: RNA polymerase sigma factor [Bacteroidota bacterium]|nr:RNA polymerase sigma factor [Bacteroidota bacterium]